MMATTLPLFFPASAKNLADAGLVDLAVLGKSVVSQAEDDGWLPALSQHVAAATVRQKPEAPVTAE